MTKNIIKPFKNLPCKAEKFTINDKMANTEDFGYSTDFDPDYNDDFCGGLYGCGNCIWKRQESLKKNAMNKYHLTEDEYNNLCDNLEEILSVGICNLCN